MNRSILSVAAVGVIFLALGRQAEPGAEQDRSDAKHAAVYMKCAEECSICQRACDACAAHCADLLAEGKKHHQATLRSCQDCGSFCSAAAAILARRGPFSDLICKACTEACTRCAKECEKHGGDDAEMKRCAETCRRCELSCRDMLTHISAAKTAERRD